MSIPISDYAEAAMEHAVDQHGVQLEQNDVSQVDWILDREREGGAWEDRNAVALCYGAWVGEMLCRVLHADWVGLSEPTAPRVRVQGVDCSPIDAVSRRLANASSPRIAELVDQLRSTLHAAELAESAVQRNRVVWESLNGDSRFVADTNKQLHRAESLAALDPWLLEDGPLDGKHVLCLAAGGGTHGPLLASAGASVTVVDFSASLLAIDKKIAAANGLTLETLEASMEDLSRLASDAFDVVVQPVSACYVSDLGRVYREVHRVLKLGGLYLLQHKQPGSLQASSEWIADSYGVRIQHASGQRLPKAVEYSVNREAGTIEFLHSLDSMLGGLCRQGFAIEDVSEPPRGDAWAKAGTAEHRACYLPPYLKIKARRTR